MKKRYLFLGLTVLIILSIISLYFFYSTNENASSCKPEKGFVPDETTAIRISEAILIPIYGKEDVLMHRPYKAELTEDGIWKVEGTHKPNYISIDTPNGKKLLDLSLGGVPNVDLQKSDGKILKVEHSE